MASTCPKCGAGHSGKCGMGAGADKKWIAGATKNKGGLHKSLGVPQGQKIPPAAIAKAASKPGKVGKQARLAQTLSKLH